LLPQPRVVGDLRDQFDGPAGEPSIRKRGDGSYELDGRVRIPQAADRLDADLDDGSRTVGGLVLNRLGQAPEVGDTVETGGYTFEVTAVDGMGVSTVLARPVRDGPR